MQSISSYINPNTRGLTSNYKNTAIKDKETYNEAMSQHLLNPVEDLVQVLKTPIKLAKSSSLSRQIFLWCTGCTLLRLHSGTIHLFHLPAELFHTKLFQSF